MAAPVPQKDDVEHWTVEQVAAWLQQVELPDCCDSFLRKGIDGHSFLQLSEEDLFQWGRDVSIRNRWQILKLVSQIKNLPQLSSTARHSIDDATDCDVSDFSRNEEVTDEYARQEMQLPHEENIQGEDLYLVPLPARPTTTHSNTLDRRLPQPSHLHFPSSNYPSPNHQGAAPWNLHSQSKETPTGCRPGSDIQDKGGSQAPPIPSRILGRAPVPLPEPQMISPKKISPKAPRVPLQFQVPPRDMITCSPFLGTKITQNDIHPGPGTQSFETNYNDTGDHLNDDFASNEWAREEYECDDFSSDDEGAQEYPEEEMQPSQEETVPGEEGIEDLYVIPQPASPTADHSSTQDREFSGHPLPPRLIMPLRNSATMQHHGRVPWNLHPQNRELSSVRHRIESDTHNNGRSPAPPFPDRIPGRGPAPLPEQLTISQKKIRLPKMAIPPPLSGTSINQNGLTEYGGIGVKGDSFLHRHLFPANACQDNRLHSSPKRPVAKDSSQTCITQEKNDHVYEIVDIPQGSYGLQGSEASKANVSDQQSPVKPPIPPPRNQNQGFDDRDLSSQLGSISLSNTKRPLATPPGITRKQSGGHGTNQKWPSAPGSPSQANRRGQPRASTSLSTNSSHSNHNTLPEMEAPQELAPPVPIETNLPSVSLGNGECIRLIPLYQKILENPYFHLITRPHAKRLVMNGKDIFTQST